jgi:hypothetical protein
MQAMEERVLPGGARGELPSVFVKTRQRQTQTIREDPSSASSHTTAAVVPQSGEEEPHRRGKRRSSKELFQDVFPEPSISTRHLRQSKRSMDSTAWIPSTRHDHSIQNCAPNGFRLFGPAPSALLPRDVKRKRDITLHSKLERMRRDAREEYQKAVDSQVSLIKVAEVRGRLQRDLAEIQQVADSRRASVWEPCLGRAHR